MDVALRSISRQEDDEVAVLELFALIGNVCTAIQDTTQALASLDMPRWSILGAGSTLPLCTTKEAHRS